MSFYRKSQGFTIVELLIVIVVIGILAAITVIAFMGINRQALSVSMQSDISAVAKQLHLDKTKNESFPASLAAANNGAGVAVSNGSELQYTRSNANAFCVTITSTRDASLVWFVNQDNILTEGACVGHISGIPPAPTAATCFAFNSGNGSITDYYDNESNNAANPACPRDVVIPGVIGSTPVVTLSTYAFENNSITSVVMPASITNISHGVFLNNQLTSVIIPTSVTTIGNNAFNGNQLTTVTIPSSVASIGTASFRNNQLSSVTLSSALTAIPNQAFMGNQLTTIALPESILSIGTNAFNGNAMSSVVIPGAVNTIGSSAFLNNPGIACNIPTGKSFTGTGCATIVYY